MYVRRKSNQAYILLVLSPNSGELEFGFHGHRAKGTGDKMVLPKMISIIEYYLSYKSELEINPTVQAQQ